MSWSKKVKNSLFSIGFNRTDFVIFLLFAIFVFGIYKFNMPLGEAFQTKTEISLAYSAKQGNDGLFYVLDDGHARILCFDHEKNIRFSIENPSDMKSESLYIDDFCVTPEGIYISATEWDEMTIIREAVLLYDLRGKYVKTVSEKDYSELKTNKHRFYGICEKDGKPQYVECYSDYILINDRKISYENAFNAVSDACFGKDKLYILDKDGTITVYDSKSENGREVYRVSLDVDKNIVPYRLAIDRDENIYFTDIRNRQIRFVDMQKQNSNVRYSETDSLTVHVTDEEELLLLEDDGLHVVSADKNEIYLKLQKNIKMIVIQIIWILSLCLSCVFGIFLFVRVLYQLSKKNFSMIQIISIWVIGAVVIISILLCGILMNAFAESYRDKIEEQVKSAAYMVAVQLDGKEIAQIEESGGFTGSAYEHLCQIMENSFSSDVEFYRQLYCNILKLSEDEKEGYAVAYLDQSVGAYFPLDEIEQGELKKVYETGAAVWNQEVNDISGTYLSVKVPVYDENGSVCGAVAVGVETYVISDTLREMLIKTLLPIVILLMLVWMISVEVLSFASNYDIYKKKMAVEKMSVLPGHLIRLLVFLVFAAYNMTATFLPVYLMKRTDIFPEEIREVAGALPITVNLFIIGVMSLFCAKLVRRFGIRKIMVFAALCSFAGNICIFISSSFIFISIGLVFDGIGVGLITNAVYVMLTYIKDESDRTWGLSIYNGACFSGINFGMMVGSILAVSIGQRMVFCIVAVTWLLMVMLTRYMVKQIQMIIGNSCADEDENAKQKMPLGEFVRNKSIFSFIVFIQNAYIIFGSFVFYYVPIYCDEWGYGETVCSILIMLYSQVAVLGSQKLTEWFSKVFGKYAIYMALGMNVTALLIFTVLHNMSGMIIALLLLGIGAAYGKPVQQNYYLDLEEVKQYGEDNAIGIYNFTENIGESLGPIVFGRLMTGARLKGKIGIFCSIITGMLCLHYFTCRKEFRNEKRREEI